MSGHSSYPEAIAESVLDNVPWPNAKGPHGSSGPTGDISYISKGPKIIDRGTRCSRGGVELCPGFWRGHRMPTERRKSDLFVTKFCLCNKRAINDIAYRSHIIRLDASFLKFLSVEFRISIASFQLCFEPAELKGLQLIPIHRFDLCIEIFSSLVHFTPHAVDSRMKNVFLLKLSTLGEHAFVPFGEGWRIET
jgi:hypothetical protein